MLLQNLIAQHQQAYTQAQVQIELLQEQQRQIQAHLQQLGSVESQMISAVQAVQEAISAINEHCPGELENYKQMVSDLFGTPIAQIEASDDSEPDNDPDNDPTPPSNSDKESIDIDAEPVTQQPTLTLIKGAVARMSYNKIKEVIGDYKLDTKGKALMLKERFINHCEAMTEVQQLGVWEYLTNVCSDFDAA